MPVKIRNASRMFMPTPASRMVRRVRRFLRTNEFGVVRLAVLPFHAHKAADGQPVERVGRALLVRVVGQRLGREADAELVHLDPGAARDEEVAELVDDDEADEDDQKQDNIDQAVAQADEIEHQLRDAPALVMVAAVAQARTSASSAISSSSSGAGAVAEALDRVRTQRGNAHEIERAVHEPVYGDIVRSDQCRARARSAGGRLRGRCAGAGKALQVDRLEAQRRQLRER